jgi:hypothetical protein
MKKLKLKMKLKMKLKNNIIIFIISTQDPKFEYAYYFNMIYLFNNYETKYNIFIIRFIFII